MTKPKTTLTLAMRAPFQGRLRVLVALMFAAIASACGATATTTTGVGPTPAKCIVSVSASPPLMDASGGAGSVVVTTQPECTWTASTDAGWISALSPASGQGSAEVAFQATPNPDGIARQAGVTVSGQRATISQAAASCRVDLAESSARVPATGGIATVSVISPTGCAWQVSSNSPWLSVTAGNSGNGNGTVTFAAASNTGIARTGVLVIEGQSFTVSQGAAVRALPCQYVIQPTSAAIPAAGGSGVVAVNAAAGCVWNATTSASWIVITSGANGNGADSVRFSVGPNTGSARTGNVSISGEVLSIRQAGNCSVSVDRTTQSVGASAGISTPIAVSGPEGCTWTATSAVPWLTIVSGTSGSGNGSVTFSVAANSGPVRNGTLAIAGQTFTVTQTGNCTYSIAPTSQSIAGGAGGGTPIAVSTSAGCSWTAAGNVPWLAIASGSIGSGNGSVTFTVTANPGAARTGTLTVAGQTFTVTQAASCSYAISPSSKSSSDKGGDITSSVTAPASCSWTAVSNAPWITVTSGASGSGDGKVTFRVAENRDKFERIGTLTIAGNTFTVTQKKH